MKFKDVKQIINLLRQNQQSNLFKDVLKADYLKDLSFRAKRVLEEAESKGIKYVKDKDIQIAHAFNSKYIYNGIIITKDGKFFIFNFSNKDTEKKLSGNEYSQKSNAFIIEGKINENKNINIEGILNINFYSDVIEKLDFSETSIRILGKVFDQMTDYKYDFYGKNLNLVYAFIKTVRFLQNKHEFVEEFIKIYKNANLDKTKNVELLYSDGEKDVYMLYNFNTNKFGFFAIQKGAVSYEAHNINLSLKEFTKYSLHAYNKIDNSILTAIVYSIFSKKSKFIRSRFNEGVFKC